MKAILKPIFEILTDSFQISDDIITNCKWMAIIGLIAFVIAYKIVGKLYEARIIYSSGLGSLLHWIIRLIAFTFVFWIFKFAMENTIVAITIAIIILGIYVILKIVSK